MNGHYKRDIDGLRGLAIALVVAYHYFQTSVPNGYLGVDIFFVTSGYLITRQIVSLDLQNSFSLSLFYARRILRIFPALLTLLVACSLLGWWVLLPEEFEQLGLHIFGGIFFISNYIFWHSTGYFDPMAGAKPLFHLWSLSVEEQFYFTWPFFLMVLSKFKKTTWQYVAIAAAFSFLTNFAITSPVLQFYFPICRFWEFFFGASIGIYELKNRPLSRYKLQILGSLGAILIAYPALASGPVLGSHLLSLVLVCTGTSLIITSSSESWINKKIFSNASLRHPGLWSYGIYLWHWPIFVFGRLLVPDNGLKEKLGLLILTTLISAASYHFLEWPIRRIPKARYKLAIYLIIAMSLAIGLFGAAMTVTEGNFARIAGSVEAEPPPSILKQNNTDFSSAKLESCGFITTASNSLGWCSDGNSPQSPPDLIVIGDSFASYFGNMLAAFVKEEASPAITYRTVSFGQCPLLLGFGSKDCRKHAEQTIDYIAKNTSIKYVALSSHWSAYVQGNQMLEMDETEITFRAALDRTLATLKALNIIPVLTYSPPPGRSPRFCLKRFGRFENNGNCINPIRSIRDSELTYREIIDSVVQKENLVSFDPSKYLCNADGCQVYTNGKYLYYSDGMHLSPDGALFLEGRAHGELMRLFNRDPTH